MLLGILFLLECFTLLFLSFLHLFEFFFKHLLFMFLVLGLFCSSLSFNQFFRKLLLFDIFKVIWLLLWLVMLMVFTVMVSDHFNSFEVTFFLLVQSWDGSLSWRCRSDWGLGWCLGWLLSRF